MPCGTARRDRPTPCGNQAPVEGRGVGDGASRRGVWVHLTTVCANRRLTEPTAAQHKLRALGWLMGRKVAPCAQSRKVTSLGVWPCMSTVAQLATHLE
jgi:hypothetical protein